MEKRAKQQGFSIVELLVVIIVIAILAVISLVAYNGIQDRALESRRTSDMAKITKALEVYKIKKGDYPITQSNSTGGWERSAAGNPDNFLRALKDEGVISSVPVDPINSAPQGVSGPESTFTSYVYYRYNPGQFGCDASLGSVYVLKIQQPGGKRMKEPGGLSCGTRNIPGYGLNSYTIYWRGQTAR